MSTALVIATRGSALALAQSKAVQARCQTLFPELDVQIRIIKTTGDKLQTASMSQPVDGSTKGLFTKELETALLEGEAHLAVHSLKDLPTELPEGLTLAATGEREDVRDVLIARAEAGLDFGAPVLSLRRGAVIATSSTRRAAQLQALRPDLQIVPIRGNVGTRLKKTAAGSDFDATLLALAGLRRLHFSITPAGIIEGEEVPLPEATVTYPAK